MAEYDLDEWLAALTTCVEAVGGRVGELSGDERWTALSHLIKARLELGKVIGQLVLDTGREAVGDEYEPVG